MKKVEEEVLTNEKILEIVSKYSKNREFLLHVLFEIKRNYGNIGCYTILKFVEIMNISPFKSHENTTILNIYEKFLVEGACEKTSHHYLHTTSYINRKEKIEKIEAAEVKS